MLVTRYGTQHVFIGFAVIGTLGWVFMFFFVQETKDKTILEINKMYEEEKSDKEERQPLAKEGEGEGEAA